MYDISKMRKQEAELLSSFREDFGHFFRNHDYKLAHSVIAYHRVTDLASVERSLYGSGLYLIMTDYCADKNECRLQVDDMKVIYRGHSRTVKSRLKSHLLNTSYRSGLKDKGVRYDVCMKLDERNGIDITDEPYRNYAWGVVVHKMTDSSESIREQAELAFDDVFGRPFASREAGKPSGHT